MLQSHTAETAVSALSPATPEPLAVRQRIRAALDAVRAGVPVVLMDDYERENEADLIFAAERLSEQGMARMIRDGSGIICLCLTDETLSRLDLPQMVQNNESPYGTAFTVTIEARTGVSTGVSARDRLTTIQAAIHPDARPDDLLRPGHVFPLRAHPGGILARQGHTEGSVCLAAMAGLRPMGVLCELMNPDGTMMRGQQVFDYAQRHGLPVLAIADLVAHSQQAPQA